MYIRDMFLHKEMQQLLMALDFDPLFQCWSEFFQFTKNVVYFDDTLHHNTLVS